MDIVGRARRLEATGRHVCHLEVGQPSTPLPEPVRRRVAEAVIDGQGLGYSPSTGFLELKAAIAARYRRRDGVDIDAAQVAVTTGASAAAMLAIMACFEVGDRVGVVEPGYPCYSAMMAASGVEPVRIGVDSTTRYAPTAETLESVGKLAGLFLAHPQNPTGTALSASRLDEVLAAAHRLGCRVIVDEIYRDISFSGPLPTAAGRGKGEIVISSFSKYFSMTGWRLGWMVLPDDLVDAVDRLCQNVYLAPPTVAQIAALAALRAEADREWDPSTETDRYRTNRDLLIAMAEDLGADDIAPADGAFYVYARLDDHAAEAGGSLELARTWLDAAAVATAPGVDFDRKDGNRWIRFSAAGATDDIVDAAARLAEWNRNR